MNDEQTYFEHEDGSIAIRPGILPVSVGMTVYAQPNTPLIVRSVNLRIPSDRENVTRLHVRLAPHPNPTGEIWVELH
jgi:hypothetical protein